MNDNKQPNSKAKRQDLSRRILAIVMAALMLLGIVASTVSILMHTYAADVTDADTTTVMQEESTNEVDSSTSTETSVSDTDPISTETSDLNTEDSSSEETSDTDSSSEDTKPPTEDTTAPPADPIVPQVPTDHMMRIGLMYGSGVTPSFRVSSSTGFVFGAVDKKTDVFTPVWETKSTDLTACQDANLAKDSDGYYVPASQGVVIGGYHLELPASYSDKNELMSGIDRVNAQLMNAGIYSSLIYAFPVYMNGALRVRIGDFGSTESATNKVKLIQNATGETPTVIAPMDDTVTMLDPTTNVILFEARATTAEFGVQAKPNSDGTASTIMTPAKNTYEGTFLFKRYSSSKATGIAVTNFLGLEQYVAGVVPYEVSTSWGYESVKAFTIIVRSYSLATAGKHSSLGIDLCNSTDCQAYLGTKKQDAIVKRAIEETRGTVIAYNGKVCSAIYFAVAGGCTVDIGQIWNGTDYPYLRAIETPWEDYAAHYEGQWFSEVSGQELYQHLYSKGYTKLKSAVSKIEIKELANNSTYVYVLEITDSSGNVLTLKGTDIIRVAIGSKYINSSNFVVAHKGDIPILDKDFVVQSTEGTVNIPLTRDDTGKKTIEVMTAEGIKKIEVSDGLTVITPEGETKIEPTEYDIPADALARVNDKTNDKFIFIGKGWGHGGGYSQWGGRCLAVAGAKYDEIIDAYFQDIELVDFRTLARFAE